MDNGVFSSPAEKAGRDFDQEILTIQAPTRIPPKHVMFVPATLRSALARYPQRKRIQQLATAGTGPLPSRTALGFMGRTTWNSRWQLPHPIDAVRRGTV